MNAKIPSLLVVDDEVDNCRNFSDIFSDLGYEVDTANEGIPALELVRKRPFDLVLLDLKMPGMDGLTLYREIKKIRAGTVAIIVSGYATRAIADEAITAGVMQVLPKPADLSQLFDLMNEALRQPLSLIVDDDEDLCKNLWDLMHGRGYRVCLAHDESQAVEQLTVREYSIVLIDMKLPTGDGQRVFQLVKRANPSARTIMITGYRSELEGAVQQLTAAGADAVFYKPFDVPELLNTVERLTKS